MKRFVLFTFLLLAFCNAGASELPSEIQSFIDDRDICDHFRGEPWDSGNEPDVKERREFISKSIKKFCTGTDKRLFNLRQKYRNNQDVIERMSDYEDAIELQ
jgi:hypothetical protein